MHDAPGRPFRHVVLVGLMGAGKTTVGQRLAARLGWSWHDSDVDIEAATGLTVRALRDRDGVDAMHDLEAVQLLEALAQPGPSVISAAASVVDSETCRAALATRFATADHRPAYGPSPGAFLAEQAERREPLLRLLDPIVIDIGDIGPDEAAARVVQALGSIRP